MRGGCWVRRSSSWLPVSLGQNGRSRFPGLRSMTMHPDQLGHIKHLCVSTSERRTEVQIETCYFYELHRLVFMLNFFEPGDLDHLWQVFRSIFGIYDILEIFRTNAFHLPPMTNLVRKKRIGLDMNLLKYCKFDGHGSKARKRVEVRDAQATTVLGIYLWVYNMLLR